MKYITKAKGANRFKTYDCITDFDIKDFDECELYEVKALNKEQYGSVLRQQKIAELKKELEELGVDLTQPTPPAIQSVPNPNTGTKTSESPLLEGDKVNGGVAMSKIKKQDGTLFTLQEITDAFYKLKDNLEKEVKELMFGTYDENGITLMMTDIRKDLPRQLPNGIPVKQALG